MLTFKILNGKVDKHEKLFNILNVDGEYIIKKYNGKRTLPQNDYYWGLIGIICKEMFGETSKDSQQYIHGVLCMKFLLDESRKMPFVRSTSSLNKKEMMDYIENIKNFMAGFGIILPSAEEYATFINN